MKLACPKCRLSLRVPDQKVPEAGAWARCPRCQERFFINPAGHSIEELTRPPAADEAPTRSGGQPGGRRDRTSQELLDRLKARQGRPDGPDYTPELITIYPEPAVPEYAYRAISAVMLCLPLVAVLILFNTTNDRLNTAPRPEPAVTVVERLNDQENPDFIRRDLVNIKRDHLRRKRSYYQVDYQGPESRAFKYFMYRLAPGVCSEISQLQVRTQGLPSTADFAITAICLEPEGRRLEMMVKWIDRAGRITFPYNNRSEDFLLYPDSTRSDAQPAVQTPRPDSSAATAAAAPPPRRPLAVETRN